MGTVWGDHLKKISTLLIALIFVGCARQSDDLLSLREKSEGIIIKSSDESIAKIEASYGIEAETINKDAGLFLIKGISQDEIKDLDLDTKTFPNTFVNAPRTLPYPKIIANTIKALVPDTDAPKSEAPAIMCDHTGDKAPLAVITANKNVQAVLDIETNIELHSAKSLSNLAVKILRQTNDIVKITEEKIKENIKNATCNPSAPVPNCIPANKAAQISSMALTIALRDSLKNGTLQLRSENLKVMWFLEDSVGQVQRFSTQDISFKPNRVGQYTAHLLIVDPSSGGCGLESMPVNITANKKLSATPTSIRKLKEGAGERFVQLRKTGNIEARKQSTGKEVIVAVIDTGVNYNHQSIRPNIAINALEIPDNGIDDDNNGLVDDAYGYDFTNSDPYAFDDNRHGTHVAGIIAGTDIGLAPDAKILPIKVLPGSMATILKGMSYAIKMKASVVNMSLRGYSRDPRELMLMAIQNPFEEVIKSGIAAKTLFVLAAGNETINNDSAPIWPAKSRQTNAITVAAISESDTLTDYSNYGVIEVDIAAYGGTELSPIYSANLHEDLGSYVGLSGTSMAAPVVAGITAQIKQLLPNSTAEEVIEIIRRSSVQNDSLKEKISFASQVSSINAVNFALEIQNGSVRLP